jgi:hypothetical protein
MSRDYDPRSFVARFWIGACQSLGAVSGRATSNLDFAQLEDRTMFSASPLLVLGEAGAEGVAELSQCDGDVRSTGQEGEVSLADLSSHLGEICRTEDKHDDNSHEEHVDIFGNEYDAFTVLPHD